MSFGLRFRLYLNFPGKVALVLGVCQAVLGILDIVLAVVGFAQKIWGHYYATGIWCGVVVFIDGLCGVLASQTRTGFGVKTFFTVSIVSTIVTFIMVTLSFGGLDFRSNFYDRAYLFSGKNDQPTKAIHGSLLVLALIEFIVSIINASMCLKPTCNKKTEWTYSQTKTKPPESHRPDIPRGVMGGNPDYVPASEQPMIGRYRSPRRQQNGTTKAYQESTETSEFLPKQPDFLQHISDETAEQGSRSERRWSREFEHDKENSRLRTQQGRVYGRQSGQRKSEATKERGKQHPSSQVSYERSTIPKRHNQKQPPYGRRTSENDNLATGKRKARYTPGLELEIEGESGRSKNQKVRELPQTRQPLVFTSDNSWERQHQEQQFHGTRQDRRSASSERRSSQGHQRQNESNECKRSNISRECPLEDRAHNFTRERESIKRQNSDRRRSLEQTNSVQEPVTVMASKTNNRKTQRLTDSEISRNRPDGSDLTEKRDRKPRSHNAEHQGGPSELAVDSNSSRHSFSPDAKVAPLRRSIGSRGSYNAAVNLMPTESLENLPSAHHNGTKCHYIPPTAFGEEELPGYEEIRPKDFHTYSTVKTSNAQKHWDRSTTLEQSGTPAEAAFVSVADEEIQEILGTGDAFRERTPMNGKARNDKNGAGIPYMDDMLTDKVAPASQVICLREERQPAVSHQSTCPNDHSRDIERSEDSSCEAGNRILSIPPDQSVNEQLFALPAPMRSSPALVRGHRNRASDQLPRKKPEDIPDIKMQKSFRASFPQRRKDKERNPRRWGISVTDTSDQSLSTESHTTPAKEMDEDSSLKELSVSFPLLRAVGGVDFGLSDQESYLETPDSTVYSFTFDEVKPRVFTTSPYRTPRKSSPLTGFSVPKMPSSDEEVESRARVIETVNVGVASPPNYRRHPPQTSALYQRERVAFDPADNSSANNKPPGHWKPLVPVSNQQSAGTADETRQPKEITQPKYFYPPERLPSKVDVDSHHAGVGPDDRDRRTSQNVPEGNRHLSSEERRSERRQFLAHNTNPSLKPTLGNSRPEDANVAFYAFQETLSGRSAWERQTYPPILTDEPTVPQQQTNRRTVGRAALRRVMRSEQAAQEEPLQQPSYQGGNKGDARMSSRRCAVPFAPEPSAPPTGGPPPYSEVARSGSRPDRADRAPLQPHSSGRPIPSQPNRTNRPRRQPVFSLVL